MKIKKFFNASFEQSKKIVLPRVWLFWGNEYVDTNSGWYPNRIFSFILMLGVILMMWMFDVLALSYKHVTGYDTYPGTNLYIYYIGRIVQPFLIVVLILLFLATSRLLLPKKTLPQFRLKISWMTIFSLLAVALGSLPLALGLSLGNGGIIYTILCVLLLISLEYYQIKKFLNTPLDKTSGSLNPPTKLEQAIAKVLGVNSEVKGLKRIIRVLSRLVIILLIISIIGMLENYLRYREVHLSLLSIIYNLLFPLAYLVYGALIIPAFRNHLTWIYMKKYPTEYRLYYKIPDSYWYMSEKRAAKHPHVYPPVNETKYSKIE